MEYLYVLAKKWRYFLFLSFLKGKKKRKKSGNQMKSKRNCRMILMRYNEIEYKLRGQDVYKRQDVRTALKDYDAWFYTTVDKDDAADLQDDMKVILVIRCV